VLGVEKMTDASSEAATVAINAATDTETEGEAGLTFPGFWGLVMQRYMRQFGASREQIAAVTIKNRRHGVSNEKAQFRSPVTLEDILSSRAICDPILLYDCCPITDGAAALVLTAAELATSHPGPVRILGSGLASGPSRVADYEDLTTFPSTIRAARQAYSQAHITPDHIDVVELHDCFSMAEVVDSEDLGLILRGKGAHAAAYGETAVGGRIPINPSGGLLSKGHPVGATGCGQIYEIVRQLRGIHPNQVPGARIGLTHNAGGTSTVATVHILGMMG
jgi:acetyl-CoA C-acetyltransferase